MAEPALQIGQPGQLIAEVSGDQKSHQQEEDHGFDDMEKIPLFELFAEHRGNGPEEQCDGDGCRHDRGSGQTDFKTNLCSGHETPLDGPGPYAIGVPIVDVEIIDVLRRNNRWLE